MRRKRYPINTLSRARLINTVWERVGPAMEMGDVTHSILLADIAQVTVIEDQIRDAEIQLAALRNQRDALYMSLWDKVKRIYDCVKGFYGDDSTECELIGRKRASKRKPRSRSLGISS